MLHVFERIAECEADNAQLRAENHRLYSELAQLRAENAELRAENVKLQAQRDGVRAAYQESLETIKRLEEGLLGPKTEKLPAEGQLTLDILALVMQGRIREDNSESETSEKEAGPDPGDNEAKGKEPSEGETPTGRKRKPRTIPRLEIEIIPLDVQREGLDAFECIGEESCEVTERRQGGTIIVTYKRLKFVRKKRKKGPEEQGVETGAEGAEETDASRVAPESPACGVRIEAASPDTAGLGGEIPEPNARDEDSDLVDRLEPARKIEGADEVAQPARETADLDTACGIDPRVSEPAGSYPSRGRRTPPDGESGAGPPETEPITVYIAPTPDLPIERGAAGPALLAETIVRRWIDAMPLTRMEKMFAREGLPLAKSTICGWHEALSALVRPLIEAMHRDALRQPVLCTDATGVRVQAKGQCSKGHFFVLIAPKVHVLFFYAIHHNKAAVDVMLSGFRGSLVADAHSIYDHLYVSGFIIEVGCWAHLRRYFHKALETDPERAKFALTRIAALFKIESEIEDKDLPAKLEARQKRSKSIVEAFFEWCVRESLNVVDDTPIQKAIRYALNHRIAFMRFLEDARLPLHNNWSEGQLRREAVGRKNWMFLGTHEAGDTNARFMSLLASAELHGLEPYAYIRDLLCLLPTWPASRVLELAPAYWNQTLQQTDAQQRLDANVFRRVSLGLDPVSAAHTPED